MNRIKDYAGFVGWFAGLGYIVLSPLTAPELGGKPFGASIFCRDGVPGALDFLCNSADPLRLPPGLHAIGCLSAVFVMIQLLCYCIKRSRRANRQDTVAIDWPARLKKIVLPRPSLRKPGSPLRRLKPRKEFGLRGVPH